VANYINIALDLVVIALLVTNLVRKA